MYTSLSANSEVIIIIMFAPIIILNAVAGLALFSAPVSARTWAGSVNMDDACHEQQGSDWAAGTIATGNDSAYDWRCFDTSGAYRPEREIDVSLYCSTTYGNGAYADPQGGGFYDWGCYFP